MTLLRFVVTIVVGVLAAITFVKRPRPSTEPSRTAPPPTSHAGPPHARAPIIEPQSGEDSAVREMANAYNQWAADPTPEHLREARLTFVTAAERQLQKRGVPRGQIPQMAPGTELDDARFAEVTDGVTSAAKKHDVRSRVSFLTNKPGAIVNYQLYGERVRCEKSAKTVGPFSDCEPAKTVGPFTNCDSPLHLGWYYIWTTRNGKKTSSDTRQFTIAGEHETVNLEESP
jgi:hypothetical protein